MARASVPTLLSLDRYAKILGIAPPHFNQGVAGGVFSDYSTCSGVWWQHPWQKNDRISREDLASAIAGAEFDIAKVLGYWPAPVWISGEQEQQPWPRYQQPEVLLMVSRSVSGRDKVLATRWGKVLGPGRRATTLLAAGAAPVYSDADGDGYSELATVTVAAGALTDWREIKVYFPGKGAVPEWEIRPALSQRLTGGNFVLTFYSWQLVPEVLWEDFPDSGLAAIDLTAVASRLATVDVYREYLDGTQAACQFSWLPDLTTTPDVPVPVTQNGTFVVQDEELGQIQPIPADYSVSAWARAAWPLAVEPDFVRLWYRAGEQSQAYRDSLSGDPLSQVMAETIAWLATARLSRPVCSCAGVTAMANWLQEDLGQASREVSYTLSADLLDCPWGTRRGAIWAWQRAARSGMAQMGGGVV